MRIGELERRTGLPAKTIRFYETAGLLPAPARTPSGYRSYRGQDVERLGFIVKARRVGFNLSEIRSILVLAQRQKPTCVHVWSLIESNIARVDRLMEDFKDFRRELERLRKRSEGMVDCRPVGGRICSIIEESGIELTDAARAVFERTPVRAKRKRKPQIDE